MSYAGDSLRDRTVVVTGASSGIGAGIAQAMAAEGARLVLTGRDAERLERVAALARQVASDVRTIAVDLTAVDTPEAIAAAAPAVDVLVHCAGIFEPQPFETTPAASVDRQWELNVRAPFLLTQALLGRMPEGSAVVFISSIAGSVGFPQSAAYCATKGAVELMTRALATELAPRGIRVNAVAPGNIHTPMNAHQFAASAEYERSLIERTPLGRMGEVEDIAPAVVFLASGGARFIQGATLLVDGGWTAQ
jgi:NAD(P)-dependent dehydrogenase (short-subunit alcohol dehydrogenase family)